MGEELLLDKEVADSDFEMKLYSDFFSPKPKRTRSELRRSRAEVEWGEQQSGGQMRTTRMPEYIVKTQVYGRIVHIQRTSLGVTKSKCIDVERARRRRMFRLGKESSPPWLPSLRYRSRRYDLRKGISEWSRAALGTH